MAASVGSARRPFTATWWKPPANHMARMMALSSTSTTLQQKRGRRGQSLAAHAPSGATPTPAGASTPFLGQGHCSHWRRRAILGRGPGGRSTRAGARPRPHRPPFLTGRHLRLGCVGGRGRSEETPGQASEGTHTRQYITEPGCSEIVQRTRETKHV